MPFFAWLMFRLTSHWKQFRISGSSRIGNDLPVQAHPALDNSGARQMSDNSDKMSDKKMKDYRITVRFPAELRQRLRSAARRAGTRESDLVRVAVERQLAAEDDALTAYE